MELKEEIGGVRSLALCHLESLLKKNGGGEVGGKMWKRNISEKEVLVPFVNACGWMKP